MDTLPVKPVGSAIDEAADPGGVTLSWPAPAAGPARAAVVAFLVVWLCLWAAGWTAVARDLVTGSGPPSLVFLLAVLTVGGGLAVWTLWAVIRPTRPESVRLEAEVLRYDPGRGPYDPWRRSRLPVWGHPPAPPPAPAATVARSDIGGFVLEQVGGRRRLCLARGADRLEIGAGLREPDREWLFAVLRRWHAPDQPTGAAGSLFESQRSTTGPGG